MVGLVKTSSPPVRRADAESAPLQDAPAPPPPTSSPKPDSFGQGVEIELRTKLVTGRVDHLPKQIAGMLKDDGGKTIFVPADEQLQPFVIEAPCDLPRGVLLVATSAKQRNGAAAVYKIDARAETPHKGAYVGVVDYVDGKPHLAELGSKPPRAWPLDPAVQWAEGTVVAIEQHGDDYAIKDWLAEGGTPAARCWQVLGREGLDPTFPPEALAQVEQIDQAKMLADPALVDRTSEPFFAIDNKGRRDIDQAMRLERLPNGNIRVSYALADLAAYVKPGTPLWSLAMERGASFYLPAVQVGMQPPGIHDGVVSLQAHEEHRALIFNLEIAKDGTVVSRDVERAKIKSRAQLTYDGVSAFLQNDVPLENDDHGKPVPDAVKEQLALFEEVGSVLMNLAHDRGVVEPERREMQTALDGTHFFLKPRHDEYASKLNAQISILANVAGAEALVQEGLDVPAIFKAHDPPWPKKLRMLACRTDRIIMEHSRSLSDPVRWRWRKNETLAQWVERLKEMPRNDVERRISRALQQQVISIQVSSQFVREPKPHEGLKLERYGRFTAPMREAVGLVSHALLVQLESWRRARAHLPAEQAQVLWRHLLIGAVVDPQKLSPERRAAVQAALALEGLRGDALAEAVKKLRLAPVSDGELALVDDAVQAAVTAGNRAGQKQGQIDGAARRLLFDDLFLADLGGKPEGDPAHKAPTRTATVMQVSDGQVRVQLEDPLVEVKIDLEGTLEDDGAALRVKDQRLLIGSEIQIRATHHDGERLHFALA